MHASNAFSYINFTYCKQTSVQLKLKQLKTIYIIAACRSVYLADRMAMVTDVAFILQCRQYGSGNYSKKQWRALLVWEQQKKIVFYCSVSIGM